MRSITKKINGFNVQLGFNSDDHRIQVHANVYPFISQFHSAEVSVVSPSDFDGNGIKLPEYSLGFGGNTFTGVEADRMIEAAQIALSIGRELVSKSIGLQDGSDAAYAFERALEAKDFEELSTMVAVATNIETVIGERKNWNYRRTTENMSKTLAEAIIRMPQFDMVVRDLFGAIEAYETDKESLSIYADSISILEAMVARVYYRNNPFQKKGEHMNKYMKLMRFVDAVRGGKTMSAVTEDDIWNDKSVQDMITSINNNVDTHSLKTESK